MEYPWMREELIQYIHTLSDFKYQCKAWVNLDFPVGVEDCLDFAIHFLYDDTDLSTDPQSWIGIILENQEEALLVTEVIKAIDSVFEDIGMEASDEKYITSQNWPKVLEAASNAYQLMKNQEIN